MDHPLVYKTFIFRPNPKKKKEYILEIVHLIVVTAFYIILYAVGKSIVGLVAAIGIGMGLYQMKKNEDRKKGVGRIGHLINNLVISTESITFGNISVPISELRNLEIDAEDYEGRPYELFFKSFGIENWITFTYQEKDYSFQFIIYSAKELDLVKTIEKTILSAKTFSMTIQQA
jgi:hypothetical protein